MVRLVGVPMLNARLTFSLNQNHTHKILGTNANQLRVIPRKYETGNLDRRHIEDNEIDLFRWLMASYNTLRRRNAQRVRVDALGRVWSIKPEEASKTLGI